MEVGKLHDSHVHMSPDKLRRLCHDSAGSYPGS